MKRLYSIFMVTSVVFLLSSCQGINYVDTEYEINGYQVYQYDRFASDIQCDRISRFGLFIRDGENDYVTDTDFGECVYTLFVKHGGNYLNLTEALTMNLFSIDDVLAIEWDFYVFETHALLYNITYDDMVFRDANNTVILSEYYEEEMEQELIRLNEISQSFYQLFIVDYYPSTTSSWGFIDVYQNDELLVTLEVFTEGIYDPATNAFQEEHSSELHGLYNSLMN